MTGDLVVIGTSWGGLDALRRILGGLPAQLDAAIVVAQHRAPGSHPNAFRDLLAAVTPLGVREAGDKEALTPGTVFVAAPDYHLMVEGQTLTLSTDAPVMYARPSVDVLFETAAESYGKHCVGVVLTGANADGARGLARIAELGGTAIVQEPAASERSEMPVAALAAVPEARVAGIDEIASLLVAACGVAKVPVP